jgi:hypothetical protein
MPQKTPHDSRGPPAFSQLCSTQWVVDGQGATASLARAAHASRSTSQAAQNSAAIAAWRAAVPLPPLPPFLPPQYHDAASGRTSVIILPWALHIPPLTSPGSAGTRKARVAGGRGGKGALRAGGGRTEDRGALPPSLPSCTGSSRQPEAVHVPGAGSWPIRVGPTRPPSWHRSPDTAITPRQIHPPPNTRADRRPAQRHRLCDRTVVWHLRSSSHTHNLSRPAGRRRGVPLPLHPTGRPACHGRTPQRERERVTPGGKIVAYH